MLIYRLPLAAGTYTLTGGFIEWWGLSRTMNHTVSAAGVELVKGNIPLSGSNSPLSGDLTFTITEPTTVEYRVTNEGAGAEKPVISWVAVAELANKTALIAAVAEAEALVETDYTSASWAPLAAALAEAQEVIANTAATTAEVGAATSALADARASLVSLVVLQAAVDLANTLVEEDFDPETWAPFAEAKLAAEEVLAKADATPEELDAATIALLAAQQALAPAAVDTSVLVAALAVADALVETDYTVGSWTPFAEAREAARALLEPADAARAVPPTQDEVNEATAVLLAAQLQLVSIATLAATVDTSAAFVEDDYTAESWAVFAAALTDAQAVLANGDATQAEVDAARGALSDAIDQLDEFVSTVALTALIASAEQLDPSDYTPESWAVFAEVLAAAKVTLADEDATQGEIDDASAALVAARDALVEVEPEPEVVDRTALEAAIASATPLDEAAYTPASWTSFAEALAAAQAVLADEAATQAEVNAARTALITAQGALVAVDASLPGSGATPDAPRGGLVSTGVDFTGALTLALILLVVGGGALIVRRRIHTA